MNYWMRWLLQAFKNVLMRLWLNCSQLTDIHIWYQVIHTVDIVLFDLGHKLKCWQQLF